MKSVLFWLLTLTFTAFSLINAAEPPDSLKLTIRRGEGDAVKVAFPTRIGKSYQFSSSKDLRGWEPGEDLIIGTGESVTLDFNAKTEPRSFFKVEVITPIVLKIESAKGTGVKLTFSTEAGKKYLIFFSNDLRRWETLGSLIESQGAVVTVEAKQASSLYYKVEEIRATPVADMIWINGGEFVMGSPLAEKDRDLDEDPLTQVALEHGFWMGKYEVTQKQYEALMGNNPSWFEGNPNWPVERVSWNDAMAYCAKLTATERMAGRLPSGYAYRLPTEAEFEYASRAGTTTRFSYGDDLNYQQLGSYAWYDVNSGGTAHPVGQKSSNPFGLHDMHGNVWEWCLDWYQDRYSGGSVTNPLGPVSGSGRVFRGGGWDYLNATCRSAFRNHAAPSRRFNHVGFRIVLGPVLLELAAN